MTRPDRSVGAVVLVVVAVVGTSLGLTAVAGTGVAQTANSGEYTRGEPDIDATVPEPELDAGTEEAMEFQIYNRGKLRLGTQSERVTSARGVTVEVDDSGPFNVKSGKTSVGSIPEGESATVTQRIAAPEDLDPGSYDVTLEVDYKHLYEVSDSSRIAQERSGSETINVEITVPDEPRFEIQSVETDVEPGGSGAANVSVKNVGPKTAHQAQATVTGSGGVTVDGGNAAEMLGDLDRYDVANFTVDVDIAESASEGEKPLEVAMSYRDGAGIEREATPMTASLAPAREQSFSITDVQDTLSVGYDGQVAGKISNDGPQAVDDAVLIVEPVSDSLFVEDTRYALPELAPNESTAFRYPMDVSGQADAGPRQLRFTVEYSGGDGSTLSDDPISKRVVVDDKRDEFSVETVSATVAQGETGELVLEITNERPETLSNVDAMLYTDSPLDTNDDEAFVPAIEPGESAEITFAVSAESGASAKTHPVELDFQYDTERGDTVVSDRYQHPVDVTAAEDGGMGVGAIFVRAMALLTAVGLGVGLWWRR